MREIRELIGPVYIPIMLLAVGVSAIAPVLPLYLTSLGAGVGLIGLVLAARGLGETISDVPSGLILSQFGLNRMIITAFVLNILFSIAIALSRSVYLIGLFSLLTGLVVPLQITGVMSVIRITVDSQVRGRASALLGGSLRIGMLAGPVSGGFLADAFGAPSVFLFQALLLSLGLFSFIISRPQHVDLLAKRQHVGRQFKRVLDGLSDRIPALVLVGLAILSLSLLRAGRQIILPLWGAQLSLDASTIGLVMSAGALFDLLLFVPAGFVLDRYGRKAAGSICLALFSLGLLMLIPASNIRLFLLASCVIGIGNGMGTGINVTTGTDLAPNGSVSEFLGLWRLYGDFGKTLGPALIGLIAGVFSLQAAVLMTAGIGAAGFSVMAFAAPETRHIAMRDSESNLAESEL
ncbi:MFS transporter [Spirochaeta dissipatitropha]